MIIRELIEKIEGEAELDFTLSNGTIEDVKIGFNIYRGIEAILQGKAPRDALVITPRVCGICNHAHLIASVRAIEDGYRNAGIPVTLTPKAAKIREFTLACELIQNHIKWFYMTILPYFEKLIDIKSETEHILKASYLSSTITKALAIFAGQWPHSSYTIPGGITCDPTYVDVIQAQSLLESVIELFEKEVVGIRLEKFLSLHSLSNLEKLQGDVGDFLGLLERYGMSERGKSHDRFMALGKGLGFGSGKCVTTTVSNVDARFVEEFAQEGTTAKAVTYKEKLYEVGPLARAMVNKTPIIKSLHKNYKDSLYTRVFARIYETAQLLQYSKELLNSLDLREASCTLESKLLCEEFSGIGTVEAARGSLIHKTEVKDGLITNYQIITPTQWNLSNGTSQERGVAIKAMQGSTTIEEATFIFRAFDVCSVCTTQ
jgi:Ni,Fe-hydrogenase I large subunit